ncbi:hypothetical protein H0A65_15285 [Alcaligenaceae bacterium]|nr:hypothetical protein [Alcaligenaceae bacterium]
MRKAIVILLACVLTPFAAHAFEIKGEPGMLHTELRIGSITVTDTKLTSDKGVVELKKMKEIKRKYDTSIYFEVVKDPILLCSGGTPASHLTVSGIDRDDENGSFHLFVLGEVKNDAGDIFVEECGGYSYNIDAKVK